MTQYSLADRQAMAEAHLAALWPDTWRNALGAYAQQPFLVRSHPHPAQRRPNGEPSWDSAWHRLPNQLDTAIPRAIMDSAAYQEYYRVNLCAPTCQPSKKRRGAKPETYAIPGLLGDWDGAWGQHKTPANLPPTLAALLAFLQSLPVRPSLIVDTGGGVHTYHLFPEPLIVATAADREAFCVLADRFDSTVRTLAQAHYGWDISTLFTGDLSRVLRLPGTISKYQTLVTTLETNAIRTPVSAFESWLLPLPAFVRGTGTAGDIGSLEILALADHYGATLTEGDPEWIGSHPHGSDTGTNLHVNPGKQVWRCWRHHSGGGPLDFIAVCEHLMPCEQARPGGLRGKTYIQTVRIANDRFHAGIVLNIDQADNAIATSLPVRSSQHQPTGLMRQRRATIARYRAQINRDPYFGAPAHRGTGITPAVLIVEKEPSHV